jgi:penicillin-binding protein 2
MNEWRKEIIQIVVVLVGLVFLVKLFFIQVLDNRYSDLANSNAILRQVLQNTTFRLFLKK